MNLFRISDFDTCPEQGRRIRISVHRLSSVALRSSSFVLHKQRCSIKLTITIQIPTWLERLCVPPVLFYRRLRYGFSFRRVPLTKGKYAIVDPDDFGQLNKHKWHISTGGGTFYAIRTTRLQNNKKRIVIKMHRCVLKVPHHIFVDHINHNGLDNRKANLRPATCKENNRSRRKVRTDRFHSRYKGLTWYKREKRWAVRIMADRKSIFLGYFQNEIDAAKAYDTAAKKYFGEFACLNLSQDTKPEPVRRLVRRPVLRSISEGGSASDPSSAAAAKSLPLRRVEVGSLGEGGTSPQKNITADSHL